MRIRYTTESFIEKANNKHNNKYIYQNFVYVKWKVKAIITCPTHGDFEQTPRDHLSGRGCSKCGRDLVTNKQRGNIETFKSRAAVIHNDYYTYDKAVYSTARKNLIITCPKHGDFLQTPDSHLHGQGCRLCGIEKVADNCRSCTEAFITKAEKRWPGLFSYANVIYTTAIKPVDITCNRCTTTFSVTPNQFLNCGNCPICDHKGFDKTKPAILYYLCVDGGTAYKIGITNYTVQERFTNADLKKIRIVKTWEYAVGKNAYIDEQFYLKQYKEFKYKGPALLSSGNTELFHIDVLELDSKGAQWSNNS